MASVATSAATKGAAAAVPDLPAGPQKPMPMAIMRNSHEVIRGVVTDIQMYLSEGDASDAIELWSALGRFNTMHTKMEEGIDGVCGGLFLMMDDHANGAATKAGLRKTHKDLAKIEKQVEDALVTNPNLERAEKALVKYVKHNEEHLVKEEQVMMPCIQAMAKAGQPMKQHFIKYMLPVLLRKKDDTKFFIKFANKILDRHDTGPKVRVFDQALWDVAPTPEHWAQWKKWMKDALTTPKYKQTMAAIISWQEDQKSLQRQLSSASLLSSTSEHSKSPLPKSPLSKSPRRRSSRVLIVEPGEEPPLPLPLPVPLPPKEEEKKEEAPQEVEEETPMTAAPAIALAAPVVPPMEEEPTEVPEEEETLEKEEEASVAAKEEVSSTPSEVATEKTTSEEEKDAVATSEIKGTTPKVEEAPTSPPKKEPVDPPAAPVSPQKEELATPSVAPAEEEPVDPTEHLQTASPADPALAPVEETTTKEPPKEFDLDEMMVASVAVVAPTELDLDEMMAAASPPKEMDLDEMMAASTKEMDVDDYVKVVGSSVEC